MEQIVPVLKGIADESRLRILNLLLGRGELCVCDIEAILGATQTKVSRHLAYLRRTGIVNARRSGLWILYSVASPVNEPRKEALAFLTRILSTNPVALRDLKRLDARMHRGCCATTAAVKPAIPTTMMRLASS